MRDPWDVGNVQSPDWWWISEATQVIKLCGTYYTQAHTHTTYHIHTKCEWGNLNFSGLHQHLVVILLYSFAKCHHWGKLSKVSEGSLCIASYNCTWIYNYLKKNLNRNKKAHGDSRVPRMQPEPLDTAERALSRAFSACPSPKHALSSPSKALLAVLHAYFIPQGLRTCHPICPATPCSLRSHSTITIHTLHSACTQQMLNNCQQEESSLFSPHLFLWFPPLLTLLFLLKNSPIRYKIYTFIYKHIYKHCFVWLWKQWKLLVEHSENIRKYNEKNIHPGVLSLVDKHLTFWTISFMIPLKSNYQ